MKSGSGQPQSRTLREDAQEAGLLKFYGIRAVVTKEMETKRPFARVAGWVALWLALGAIVFFFLAILFRSMESSMPAAYAMTLVSLSALAVFGCVVAALACGIVALSGMRKHGRKGVLVPAASGLTLAGLMLVPILISMASEFSGHARLVKAREVHTTGSNSNAPTSTAPSR